MRGQVLANCLHHYNAIILPSLSVPKSTFFKILRQFQWLPFTSADVFFARSLLARLSRVTFLHPESEQGPPQDEYLQRDSHKALHKDCEQNMAQRQNGGRNRWIDACDQQPVVSALRCYLLHMQ